MYRRDLAPQEASSYRSSFYMGLGFGLGCTRVQDLLHAQQVSRYPIHRYIGGLKVVVPSQVSFNIRGRMRKGTHFDNVPHGIFGGGDVGLGLGFAAAVGVEI